MHLRKTADMQAISRNSPEKTQRKFKLLDSISRMKGQLQ
jgi:hypothetical protein